MRTVTPDTLNEAMDFDHPIRVHADGSVSDAVGEYAPEVIVTCGDDGQISAEDDAFMVRYLESQGWTVLNGYSGQYCYAGPIMHASEYIGGRMARDILETPGVYVACAVYMLDAPEDDDPYAGWIVARKLEDTVTES